MLIKKPICIMLTVASIATFSLSGCVSNLDGETYSRDQVRKVQTVDTGVIKSLRLVKIRGDENWIGAGTGAALGGAGGSFIGGGKARIVSAVVGAVGGALLGEVTQEGLTKTKGVEMTIRKADGQEVSMVQQVDENQIFRVGDRVRIMYGSDGTTRVALDQ